MKNNKGFATSFMLFSLLALFLIVVTMLLFTMNNSTVISNKMKDDIKDKAENSAMNRQSQPDLSEESLVLYYDAIDHGNSSNSWEDLSPSGNNGTITNGTFQNNGLYLTGSGSGIVTTDSIDFKPQMTFEITLYSDTPSDCEVLDARSDPNTGYQPLYIRRSDYAGEIYSTNGGGYYQSMSYLNNDIHTLSIVYTQSGVTFYKDGVKTSTSTTPKGLTYSGNLYIGRYFLQDSHNFKGNIYAVRVYQTALTDAEVRQNYVYDARRYILQKDNEYIYDYTGSVQTFTAPGTGNYKIEAWGAGGGTARCNGSVCGTPGKGGYSSGTISLNKDEKIYIYVGQKGTDAVTSQNASSTFNGGGLGTWDGSDDEAAGAGGGATDIRLTNGDWNNTTSLASRIMVAGGGGGNSYNYKSGSGGGINGEDGNGSSGATQTTGNAFGIGKNGEGTGDSDGVAGGGGGYYGGTSIDAKDGESASGGSGYVSGHIGCVAITAADNTAPKSGCADGTTDITCSYHYSNKIFTSTVMKAGNEEMPTVNGKANMIGNSGNGFVKITILGSN